MKYMQSIHRHLIAFLALTVAPLQAAENYDVVVYGGTPVGITSAISASREGFIIRGPRVWQKGMNFDIPYGAINLLLPQNNAQAYAVKYGQLPIFAWEDESKSEHYEIWMNTEKVATIPSGEFGRLPGGKIDNYEPFRPYGYLPETRFHYYTPQLSDLPDGIHRWQIIGIDEDGNRRQSVQRFRLHVTEPPNVKLFVNHLGYLVEESKRVVVDASVDASRFEVLDQHGKVVYSGGLKSGPTAFGDYLSGDFTGLKNSGTYRIRAGSEYSLWFPVGLEAQLNYEVYFRKYRNAYQRKRCGDTTANWGARPCHLEDARINDGKRCSIADGWHASSDVRKIMRILQPGQEGLIDMKRILNPAWDSGEFSILEEIKWGNRYLHSMQLENGALVQHYYLWCGADDWGESINRYTDTIIGNQDDRILEEDTLIIDMASQSRFIKNQSTIYRLYKDTDPKYARKCLRAAQKCYDYFTRTWPTPTDYETKFSVRTIVEPVTDLMPIAYGVRANLYMYLATDNPEYRDRAVALADQLIALQEKNYIGGQKEIKGFFYKDENKEEIFCSLVARGGLDGAEGAVNVVADLCEVLPNHPKYPQWKQSLRSYLQDYLLVLSEKNAFGIVPAYLSKTDQAGGQTKAKMQRKVGELYYQYLCDDRGTNKMQARKAILLGRGAKILDNPQLRDAAFRQVHWILGHNPLSMSTVYGVGYNQPNAYKASLAPRSDGMVVQGIGGGSKDKPFIIQGHWRHCEMEICHTAWLAQAIFELLPATDN